jgi:hypothetical protein
MLLLRLLLQQSDDAIGNRHFMHSTMLPAAFVDLRIAA